MKISYNWLKEYVHVKLSAEKLAGILTMAGLSVESVKPFGSDYILEIEITANRPDWLSVIGVAREVAALTGMKLKMPSAKKVKAVKGPIAIRVKVDDRRLCPRYTARIIRNVTVTESPAWLKERIEAMGLRSINNIVDITNFCLFETGEPMHAFDLDTIPGGEVIVRHAVQGEKIVTIEGTEKNLDTSMLIIADNKKPIAIAGIMGGANTEVKNTTRNILLEAAFFDQTSVRRTARKLAIATDSSYRFERRVDMDNIVYASNRALELILKLAGGEPGAFIDIGAKESKKKIIDLAFSSVNKLLGTDISHADIKRIVGALGIETITAKKDLLKLEVPLFRNDLKVEVDVIEEVARVYGYDKIPATLPKIVEQPIRMETDVVVCTKTRDALVGCGVDEIITYSLLNKKVIEASRVPTDTLVSVANPLTNEQEVMRPSLIPGMLNALMWNINRKAKDLKLFEIGNVYFLKDGKYGEKKHLSIAVTGQAFSAWAGGGREANFYELKGIVEILLAELGIMSAIFRHSKHDSFLGVECAQITVDDDLLGIMGQVCSKALHNFDIKEKAYLAELDLGRILKHVKLGKRFEELPRYPAVFRDISILAARETLNADLYAGVKKAAGPLLIDCVLIDRYEGKQVPEGKVSLTYRLEYRDPAKTLEEKDILEVHGRVLRELEERFGAKLR